MAAPLRNWAANLLYLWFHQLEPKDWWTGTASVDAILRERFESQLLALHTRPAHEFLSDPGTALAAVLLFDQVPRNLYSGSADAFGFDPLARELTYAILARGWAVHFTQAQRQFLGMPLMHSEDIFDQRKSLAYFAELGPRFGLPFARSHYRMIARFGRYPHRNEALGRTSSPAEKRAIAAGNSW